MNEENKSVEQSTEDVTINNPTSEKKETEKAQSVEERLQALMVENAKLKKATDKATSEASSYKKQLREKLSADEMALQEKAEKEAEREEQFKQLVRENQINKLEKNFVSLGYNEAQALKAATAQYDGDTDTLFKVQAEVQTNIIKAKEAEWLKSRPDVNAGVGDEKTTVTQEQFEKMGYTQRVKFKTEFPETYKKYSQH